MLLHTPVPKFNSTTQNKEKPKAMPIVVAHFSLYFSNIRKLFTQCLSSFLNKSATVLTNTIANPSMLFMITVPLVKTILMKIPGDKTSMQYNIRGTVWLTT